MLKIFDSVKIKMFTNVNEKNREVVENFRHCRTLRIKQVPSFYESKWHRSRNWTKVKFFDSVKIKMFTNIL